MENELPPSAGATPPVIAPSPAPRPAPRGGRGWMVLALIFGFLLGLMLLVNLVRSTISWSAGAKPGRQSGRVLHEVLVENNHSKNKIAIIDVEGIITSMTIGYRGENMVALIEDQLRVAARDRAVKAVILKVDSPGGEVLASDDISRALLEFQERHRKPVLAAMGGLGASGGYYIAAPCRWIVANELTMTGSIGVIMSTFNYRGLLDKVGVFPEVYKSGRFKDMLRGSKTPEEIEPEERQMIQDMVDQTHSKFLSVVQQGRTRALKENQNEGRALVGDWEQYADGRVLTGKQAYDLGFVDELGNFNTAVRRTVQLAGLTDANLIRYQEPFRLGNIFSLFGQGQESGLKLDLGFDMPRLEAGRLYFLSPTVVH